MTLRPRLRKVAAFRYHEKQSMRPSVPGILLIVIGLLFLLRNFGFDLHLGRLLATWWPLAVIAVGVSMLFKSKRF